MTRLQRITTIAVAAVALLTPLAVSAQDVFNPERIAAIKTNCNVINLNLSQAQRRDLVQRTNRGRAYEAVLKQMTALQERVKNNKLKTDSFDTALTAFKLATTEFRSSYVRYDNALIALRQIDCSQQPDAYAIALEELRVMRAETGAAIAAADNALGQFRQATTGLQQQLAPSGGATQ